VELVSKLLPVNAGQGENWRESTKSQTGAWAETRPQKKNRTEEKMKNETGHIPPRHKLLFPSKLRLK